MLSGRGLGPAAPAVTMQPVGLEPAPQRGAADPEVLGGFRELPAVLIEGPDDRVPLPVGQGASGPPRRG